MSPMVAPDDNGGQAVEERWRTRIIGRAAGLLAAMASLFVFAPSAGAASKATITSFSPTSAGVGAIVTVTGTGFVAPCSITFGGVAAYCVVNSPTKVTSSVPINAVSGPLTVKSGGSSTTSSTSFKVALGLWISTRSGPPTTSVNLAGTGFSPHEIVDLYLGTTDEALASADANGDFTYQGLTIPASDQPGTVWVTAAGRHSALSAQGAFLVRTNWAQAGFGPAHRGTNPYENTLGVSNVASIGKDWSYTTSFAVQASPAVVNGIVYATAQDHSVYALSAMTGARLWKFATGEPILQSSPAVANGVVYAGSEDHVLYALNATTGVQLWRYVTGSSIDSSPVVWNGTVYIGSGDGNLYALNATTGSKLWSYQTANGVNTPAVVNGVVYVGSDDHNVYALNAGTGAKLWSYTTGDAVASTPAVVNGVVYVGSYDGSIYALDASTGTKLWSYVTGSAVASSPAVVNGVVYVGSYDKSVYALDATTGTKLWSYATGGLVASSPAVVNGVVYVGSYDDNIYALNAGTGVKLWSDATGAPVPGSAAVANGIVYIGAANSLNAFDLAGGLTAIPRRAGAISRRGGV
jgi:outer membrane protein assembly factor BamB